MVLCILIVSIVLRTLHIVCVVDILLFVIGAGNKNLLATVRRLNSSDRIVSELLSQMKEKVSN